MSSSVTADGLAFITEVAAAAADRQVTAAEALGVVLAARKLALSALGASMDEAAASPRAHETLLGVSGLLNAVCGGPYRTTFSAWSWELARLGKRSGLLRCWFIDRVLFRGRVYPAGRTHCQDAWQWHVERGVLGLYGEDDVG